MNKNNSLHIPSHVAIIMDGNRRWARAHSLEVVKGHEYVVNKRIEELVDHCIELGIPYLTLWAFSTENWNRDASELKGIMNLFRKAFEKNVEDLHKKGVRLNMIGDIDQFPNDIAENTRKWIALSQQNTKLTLTIALGYGGRDEIVRSVKKMIASGVDAPQLVTKETIASHLDTAGLPDPDLIIRTGGEKRLSGFFLWQSEYSELYFTDVLMPDFSTTELDKAIADYSSRSRRFGK